MSCYFDCICIYIYICGINVPLRNSHCKPKIFNWLLFGCTVLVILTEEILRPTITFIVKKPWHVLTYDFLVHFPMVDMSKLIRCIWLLIFAIMSWVLSLNPTWIDISDCKWKYWLGLTRVEDMYCHYVVTISKHLYSAHVMQDSHAHKHLLGYVK